MTMRKGGRGPADRSATTYSHSRPVAADAWDTCSRALVAGFAQEDGGAQLVPGPETVPGADPGPGRSPLPPETPAAPAPPASGPDAAVTAQRGDGCSTPGHGAGDCCVLPPESGHGEVPAADGSRGENAGSAADGGCDGRGLGNGASEQTGTAAAPAPDGAPAGNAVPSTAAVRATVRRGPADPVRELMHRHRALCERAVDPLEIAAGLEAHGVTDRTAARFRHRDVFSLADELYARVPAGEADSAAKLLPSPSAAAISAGATPAGANEGRARSGMAGAVIHLLPGTLSAVTLGALALNDTMAAPARTAVGAVGAAVVGVTVRLSLRRISRSAPAVLLALSAYWLLAYGLFGNWLLAQLLGGGPATGGPASGFAAATAPGTVLAGMSVPLSLMFAIAPAALGVHWFGAHARRRLEVSRSLDELASAVRPLLALTVVVFAAVLTVLQIAARFVVDGSTRGRGTAAWDMPGAGELTQTTALGVLLFTALLLATHGFPSAASVGLGAASLIEAAALAGAVAVRNPELQGPGGFLGRAVEAYGPGSVPAAACGCAALALLAYAFRALAGASAHHREVLP